MDKEIADYHLLCASLRALHEKYLCRKKEVRRLLEETAALRKNALLVLEKANRLTGHLTGHQRYIIGLGYNLGDIKARIHESQLVFEGGEEGDKLPELRNLENCRNLLEIKQRGLIILGIIDGINKKLLQLDLLEMRCRELILSIDKALEAFRHEARIIHRKIYPLGIFTIFYRSLRGLWGSAYFTSRDMGDLRALGNVTGHVLRIADSPII